MVPADADGVICAPIATGKPSRPATPLGEVDARVLKAMGRTDAKEVLVLPVTIGSRIVNLLYVDNGVARLADTTVGALRVLAMGVAKAYESLVASGPE